MRVDPDSTYRKFLERVCTARHRANPLYSMRAFARDLQIPPSRLCEILQGKQGLSVSAGKKISQRLKLSPDNTQVFCDLIQREHARSNYLRRDAETRLQNTRIQRMYQNIGSDQFKVIADWYHFAILQLVQLRNFKNDLSWISKALGIHPNEAQAAIRRLLKLGLLRRAGRNLQITHQYLASGTGSPSQAIQKFHRQILEKAITSLQTQSVSERDVSAILMPIASTDLPEVQKKIKVFRRKMCGKYGSHSRADRIYCLAIQFFRLSSEDG